MLFFCIFGTTGLGLLPDSKRNPISWSMGGSEGMALVALFSLVLNHINYLPNTLSLVWPQRAGLVAIQMIR